MTRVTDACELADSYEVQTGGSKSKFTMNDDGTITEKLAGSFLIAFSPGFPVTDGLTAPSFNFFRGGKLVRKQGSDFIYTEVISVTGNYVNICDKIAP